MLIQGSVLTDDYGILPNVNVEVIGENQFTTTDESGRFSINANSPASQLRFSLVGFDYDTVSVAQFQKDDNIMLLFPASNELEEVILYNDSKKTSNIMAWVLGGLVVIGIGFALSKSNGKAVNVKA